jgi:toxin-antitoxin system PIN domain toxin
VRALLDVNVLIALLDEQHVHHHVARTWFSANISAGWASCALTQLGCIRVMGNTRYTSPRPAAQIALRLAAATRTSHHEFWNADLDPLASSEIDWSGILSARHTTDVYLLALAVAREGRLVTFDQHIPARAVRGATDKNLVVLN